MGVEGLSGVLITCQGLKKLEYPKHDGQTGKIVAIAARKLARVADQLTAGDREAVQKNVRPAPTSEKRAPHPNWPYWGSRRYRRKMYGKLQLLCHQYVAGEILGESAPLRRRCHEGGRTPCAIRSYTRIDFKARMKLLEP